MSGKFKHIKVMNLLTCPTEDWHRYSGSDIVPQACEQHWKEWERKAKVTDRESLEQALGDFDPPAFDPGCPTCVAEYEQEVSDALAQKELFSKLRTGLYLGADRTLSIDVCGSVSREN